MTSTPDQPAADDTEQPQFTPPYLGQIVFIEPADTSTHYRTGSYLIVGETSGELRGFSLNKAGAYEIAHPESLPLVGATAFKVLAVDAPTADLVACLDGIMVESHRALTGGTKSHNWNDGVYERAYATARTARYLIAEQLGLPPNPNEPTFPAPAPLRSRRQVDATTAPASTAAGTDAELSELLTPLAELLRPLTLAGATADLRITFPAATSAEQTVAAKRADASRRLGEAIIATGLHPDNR